MPLEYRGFTESIETFGVEIGITCERTTKERARQMLERLVYRTPVDTGRARGGWLVGLNSAPFGEGGPDPEGSLTISEGFRVLEPLGKTFSLRRFLSAKYTDVIIANNVPYMKYLEAGRSQQAPSGIVGVTLAEQ